MSRSKRLIISLLGLAPLLMPVSLHALPSDWQQEVLIESNASDMDRRRLPL